MLQRLILFSSFLVVTIIHCLGQDLTDFKVVDSLTYTLFKNKQWDSLIVTGEQGVKNSVDYYYLRYRIGVACYEKEKYRCASRHFEKAMSFNSSDAILQEYLYYSYLYGGMHADAIALSAGFSEALIEKLQLHKRKIVSDLYFEGGTSLGQNSIEQNTTELGQSEYFYTEKDYVNDISYYTLGLGHPLTKRIFFFHAGSVFVIKKNQSLMHEQTITECKYNIYQRQYYATLNIYLGKGFVLKPAVHFVHVEFSKLYFYFDEFQGYLHELKTVQLDDYVLSASVSKNTSFFKFNMNAVNAKLNMQDVWQGSVGVTFFPEQNLNLFLNATYTWHKCEQDKPDHIFDVMAGGKIYKNLWVEDALTFGTMSNYIEKDAFIIFNNINKIQFRNNLSFSYMLRPGLEYRLCYLLKYEKFPESGIDLQYNYFEHYSNHFIHHSITGGFKWSF